MKYVYLVRAGDNHYKIGVARNVTKRLKQHQTSNPERVRLICARMVTNHSELEKLILKEAQRMRTNGGKEWLRLDCESALQIAAKINDHPEIDFAEQIIDNIKSEIYSIVDTYEKQVQIEHDKKPVVKYVKEKKPKLERPTLEEDVDVAYKLIKESGKASTSYLQRVMRIGYGRAARIIEALEKAGVISETEGNRPREILVKNAERIGHHA